MEPEPYREAHAAAARVVGLYGDPMVSWSIVLDGTARAPLDPGAVHDAVARVVASHRHLGAPPIRHVVPVDRMAETLSTFADTPYRSGDPLVRVAVGDDGRRVLVACHHGAVDGLGLMALLSAGVGTPLTSTARGIGTARPRSGFVAGAFQRLAEAVFDPPARLRADRGKGPSAGDWLVETPLTTGTGTAGLVYAVRGATADWNGPASDRRQRPVVVAVGASRRPADAVPTPDRCTAYLRLRDVPWPITRREARDLLDAADPEPDFPQTRGLGVGPLVTRALSSRLGSTVLVSNLGLVHDSGRLDQLSFYPAPGGPQGVAVGLVSAGGSTRLTIRAARSAFSEGAAASLAHLVARRVTPGGT